MVKGDELVICNYIQQKFEFSCEQIKPYWNCMEKAFADASESVVRHQYARGGQTLHRGFYCPSPIRDIVIGNSHRGNLYKTRPRTRKPSFTYGFDGQGKLITTESDSYGKEIILYTGGASVGISFSSHDQYGSSVETISLCEYDMAGKILRYLLCTGCFGKPLLMYQYELERYHYDENGLVRADCYGILYDDATAELLHCLHNIYTFSHNSEGELSGYTVEHRQGIKDVVKQDYDHGQEYPVMEKRKV